MFKVYVKNMMEEEEKENVWGSDVRTDAIECVGS